MSTSIFMICLVPYADLYILGIMLGSTNQNQTPFPAKINQTFSLCEILINYFFGCPDQIVKIRLIIFHHRTKVAD